MSSSGSWVIRVGESPGGVGKSLVTGLVALAMSRSGKSVGILDDDITGPSIPTMFGIHTRSFKCRTSLVQRNSEHKIWNP